MDAMPDLNELKGILSNVQDITDIRRTEETLRKKERLLQAVVEATYELTSSNLLEMAIGKVIGLLGNAMQLDRVNIYSYAEEADGIAFVDQLATWDADSDTVEYHPPAMQHIPAMVMAFILEALGRNEIYARPVGELEDLVLRSLLERRKVKSMVALPIFVAGRFRGFVTLNDCREERGWTSTELSILQSFGATLGVVMERRPS